MVARVYTHFRRKDVNPAFGACLSAEFLVNYSGGGGERNRVSYCLATRDIQYLAGLPLSYPVFLCLKNTLFIWKAVVFYHMPWDPVQKKEDLWIGEVASE